MVRHTLGRVKRFSPFIVIALAAAAALALLRNSGDSDPAENWKPVRPT